MITLKTKKEIEDLRVGGKLLASVLVQIAKAAKPGVTVLELDQLAEKLIREGNGEPAFKGYKAGFSDSAFPSSLCVSINDEVVHGLGNRPRKLQEGDIVGLDLGVRYKKLYTDHAVTVAVGKISPEARKLLKITEESLALALKQVKPGNYIHEIGAVVQKHVEAVGFSVVRELVGHGVGHKIHEDPRIPNFVPANGPHERVEIKEGMVLAIEPMVNAGGWKVVTGPDGWTVLTQDGSWSAHFEHTVAVTEKGCEILTKVWTTSALITV